MFSTSKIKSLLAKNINNYKCIKTKNQWGIPSGSGWLVPLSEIPLYDTYTIPDRYQEVDLQGLSEHLMGVYAEDMVISMLEHNELFEVVGDIYRADKKGQFMGFDFQVDGIRIEIKNDYKGGYRGTGNLFFQKSETNIHRQHIYND